VHTLFHAVIHQQKSKGWQVALAVTLFFAALVLVLPKDSFWITDGGNRFIQLQSLLRTGQFDIEYPAKSIDPDKTFFPRGGHHFQQHDDAIHSFYPIYFSLIVSPFYRVLGGVGLYVLPLLGTLLTLIMSCKILNELGDRRRDWHSVLVVAFCTPIFFYSLTFWEHTLAVGLSTLAIYYLLRILNGQYLKWGAAVSGMLLGVSTILREEGYIIFAAIVVAMSLLIFRERAHSLKRTLLHLVLGWGAFMLPIGWFQYAMYGNALGIHAAVYSAMETSTPTAPWDYLWGKLTNFYVYLFRFNERAMVNYCLVVPLALITCYGLIIPQDSSSRRNIIFAIGVLLSAVLMVLLVVHPNPVFNTLNTQALVSATPFLLVLAFLQREILRPSDPGPRFLGVIVSVYVAATCLSLNQADIGIIWGPRHFLALYPIAVPLVFHGLQGMADDRKSALFRKLAIVLFVVSALIQVHGVNTLFLKKNATRQLVEKVAKLDEAVIVTDVFWLGEELASIFYDKIIMQVESDSEMLMLVPQLAAKDIDRFAIVRSPWFHAVRDPQTLQELTRLFNIVPSGELRVPRVSLLDVNIFTCRWRDDGKRRALQAAPLQPVDK